MGCDREQGTHYQCDCMQERMRELEEALSFYADPENHTYRMIDLQNPLVLDGGKKARAALFPHRYLQEEE